MRIKDRETSHRTYLQYGYALSSEQDNQTMWMVNKDNTHGTEEQASISAIYMYAHMDTNV